MNQLVFSTSSDDGRYGSASTDWLEELVGNISFTVEEAALWPVLSKLGTVVHSGDQPTHDDVPRDTCGSAGAEQ